MEYFKHLDRVTILQKQINTLGVAVEADILLLRGRLREAICQAGMSGCTLEQIKKAREAA